VAVATRVLNENEKSAILKQARDVRSALLSLRRFSKEQINTLLNYVAPINRELYSPVCDINFSEESLIKLRDCLSNRPGRLLHFPGIAADVGEVLAKFGRENVVSHIRTGEDATLKSLQSVLEQLADNRTNLYLPGASLVRRSSYRLGNAEQGVLSGDSIELEMEKDKQVGPYIKALNPLTGSLVLPNKDETRSYALYRQKNGQFTPAHVDTAVYSYSSKWWLAVSQTLHLNLSDSYRRGNSHVGLARTAEQSYLGRKGDIESGRLAPENLYEEARAAGIPAALLKDGFTTDFLDAFNLLIPLNRDSASRMVNRRIFNLLACAFT
jgi:hypothetical protein